MHSASSPVWQGHYLDGRTAVRQGVEIRVLPQALTVRTASGTTFQWLYTEVRQTQGTYAGQQIRLERGGEIAESLLIADPACVEALRRVAPHLTRHVHSPAGRRKRMLWIGGMALGACGGLLALYLWGVPWLVSLAVARVPVAWEEMLGRSVLSHLAPPPQQCTEPGRVQVLDDIMTALLAPLPQVPYTLRVIVVDVAESNAFAVPGGTIVVFHGLLRRTRTAEEMAGVLAHEIQHILLRHGTRLLVQHASLGLLMAMVGGNTSGTLGFGLEGTYRLSTLHYSRQHEEEADTGGFRMLQAAAIDPAGMLAFFHALSQEERADTLDVLQYLATHPRLANRLETLGSLRQTSARPYRKLLPTYDWHAMHAICTAQDT